MKTGRGWWALVGFGVLTLAGLYVGAYYALVTPLSVDGKLAWPIYPTAIHQPAMRFFRPIHAVDRELRPQVWGPKQWGP